MPKIGGVTGGAMGGSSVTPGGQSGRQVDFGDLLGQAVSAVSRQGAEAEELATGLVSGQHAKIHETMIALEKANISLRMLTKVQGKVVSAYQEIMRMQL